jgi:hypothetical protein
MNKVRLIPTSVPEKDGMVKVLCNLDKTARIDCAFDRKLGCTDNCMAFIIDEWDEHETLIRCARLPNFSRIWVKE